MEISGLDTLQTVKKVNAKAAVQPSRVEDSITISPEAKKRAEWVEKLKQMPDLRPEKIEAALSHAPPSLSDLAHKITQSGF